MALFLMALIHEKSFVPYIEAPYPITDQTSVSNNIVQVEYLKPPFNLHLAINKPKDLLADLATAFAISS